MPTYKSVLIDFPGVRALIGAFNKEKALMGAFS